MHIIHFTLQCCNVFVHISLQIIVRYNSDVNLFFFDKIIKQFLLRSAFDVDTNCSCFAAYKILDNSGADGFLTKIFCRRFPLQHITEQRKFY